MLTHVLFQRISVSELLEMCDGTVSAENAPSYTLLTRFVHRVHFVLVSEIIKCAELRSAREAKTTPAHRARYSVAPFHRSIPPLHHSTAPLFADTRTPTH